VTETELEHEEIDAEVEEVDQQSATTSDNSEQHF
jgi:hypothetical protein